MVDRPISEKDVLRGGIDTQKKFGWMTRRLVTYKILYVSTNLDGKSQEELMNIV